LKESTEKTQKFLCASLRLCFLCVFIFLLALLPTVREKPQITQIAQKKATYWHRFSPIEGRNHRRHRKTPENTEVSLRLSAPLFPSASLRYFLAASALPSTYFA